MFLRSLYSILLYIQIVKYKEVRILEFLRDLQDDKASFITLFLQVVISFSGTSLALILDQVDSRSSKGLEETLIVVKLGLLL
jgi:hypothetical protein